MTFGYLVDRACLLPRGGGPTFIGERKREFAFGVCKRSRSSWNDRGAIACRGNAATGVQLFIDLRNGKPVHTRDRIKASTKK